MKLHLYDTTGSKSSRVNISRPQKQCTRGILLHINPRKHNIGARRSGRGPQYRPRKSRLRTKARDEGEGPNKRKPWQLHAAALSGRCAQPSCSHEIEARGSAREQNLLAQRDSLPGIAARADKCSSGSLEEAKREV
jgi:hypothetical protein